MFLVVSFVFGICCALVFDIVSHAFRCVLFMKRFCCVCLLSFCLMAGFLCVLFAQLVGLISLGLFQFCLLVTSTLPFYVICLVRLCFSLVLLLCYKHTTN